MPPRSGNVAAIIPAAGSATRFGGRANKLFALLQGQPLLLHALRTLEQSPSIRWIQVVVRPHDEQAIQRLLKQARITKALAPCRGGESRVASVARGMASLPSQASWVLVHDGARPCVTRLLIEQTIRAAKRYGAATCGMPASVTVKAIDGAGEVRLTLDREQLWLVQTPQAFRRDWFTQALTHVNGQLAQFPDDVSVLESAGFRVKVIPGDPWNLKVTTREDLVLASAILTTRTRERNSKNEKGKRTRKNSTL